MVVNLLQENAENKILIIGNNLFRLTVVACFVTIFLLIDDNGDSDNGKKKRYNDDDAYDDDNDDGDGDDGLQGEW